ncbi:MAG TPA: RNA polymerase sigma factor [Gaiellaceae bacterium]|nr:RNA polymerase sigma factor [Gaiellaceae bacterium]
MSGESPDRSLIAHIRTDPVALEALYRRYVGRVVSFAARRCSEPQDVSDLVAATFVTVIDSAQSFDPERGEVLPWILGIESHLWADHCRGVYREREVLARALGQRTIDQDEYARLEDQVDAERIGGAVGRALARLDPGEREVLLLAGHDGLTSREAAAVLGTSPTAFRMRLSRARRSLTKALDQAGEPIPAAATSEEKL